jgi:hypothetical protein
LAAYKVEIPHAEAAAIGPPKDLSLVTVDASPVARIRDDIVPNLVVRFLGKTIFLSWVIVSIAMLYGPISYQIPQSREFSDADAFWYGLGSNAVAKVHLDVWQCTRFRHHVLVALLFLKRSSDMRSEDAELEHCQVSKRHLRQHWWLW